MNNTPQDIPARPDIGWDAESEMFEDPSESCISIVSLLLAAVIVAALVAAIGFGASYFLQGVGLAVFLPVWRDHNTEARQEWVREQGEGPHPAERLVFRVCLIGFAVLMVSGYWFGGAA